MESLSKLKIRDVNDFNWISQLRYYWENESINVSALVIFLIFFLIKLKNIFYGKSLKSLL